MKSEKFDLYVAYLCFFGLPLLAIGIIAFCFYQASLGTGWLPLLAILLGLVVGAVIMTVGIAASGTDMTDFAVTSLIVIVLTIILIPVFMRARENNQRRMTKSAIRKFLREHGAIYPQPIKKGAQPDG